MRLRLLGFVDALRAAGLPCTVSESLDATRAAAVAGVERSALRECLAATLVKDRDDRPAFDEVFERYFALPDDEGKRRKKRRRGEEGGRGGESQGQGRGQPAEGTRGGERYHQSERPAARQAWRPAERRAGRRPLLALPFAEIEARENGEIRELVDELGRRFRSRWARRMRRANLGRLDVRRTIRRAMSRGGVPIELLQKRPRPGKSELIALVDLSYSTATAAEFLLALLAPARRFFRRVMYFGYVDAIAEIGFEHGHLVPHQRLDLNARSDFGRVLAHLVEGHELQMRRNTVLLVLGDARNNRRPPRADLLAKVHNRVRSVIWLNPERRERWDTGDSVMKTYTKHCDAVLNAWNLHTLLQALAALARRVS